LPTKASDSKQENGKEQKPASETSADRGGGGLPVLLDPARPKPAPTLDYGKPHSKPLKPEPVIVPQIVGLPYAAAKKRIEAAGLVLKPAQGPENALVKRQAPAAETLVKRGEIVMATLSSETSPTPVLSRVPNLLGVTGAENAGKILKQAGLDFSAYRIVDGKRILIVPKDYPQLENLKVIQQLPGQGKLVSGRTCVECIFAARQDVPPPQTTPPNVIGKTNAKSEKK
jgi:beta-lactam-binding protein with PASTA domain